MSRERIFDNISKTINQIKMVKTPLQQLRTFNKFFKFEKLFNEKGVQGIAGICYHKIGNRKVRVVFKIPLEINFSSEHEFNVLKNLNSLRTYCPNFVTTYGIIQLPISNDFINEPDSTNPFTEDKDYTLYNILLMEYIGIDDEPYSLEEYIEDNIHNKNKIISQICQLMLALQIAQDEHKLTHYDLHLNNIYMLKCPREQINVYKYKDKKYMIPTYGYYPTIIDMGLSYIKSFDGFPLTSHMNHYKYGFQSSIFDPLNDVHYLMFILTDWLKEIFKDLPKYEYLYKYLIDKIDNIFKPLKVNKERGWKLLEIDFHDKIKSEIKKTSKCYDINIFDDCDGDIIVLLNTLVILPFTSKNDIKEYDRYKENFGKNMDSVFTELKKFDFGEYNSDKTDFLYALKQLIVLYNSNRSSQNINYKQLETNFKERISKDFKALSCNIEMIFKCFNEISMYLSGFYFELLKSHIKIIDESYKLIKITCPLDLFNLLITNCTPKFEVDKESIYKIYNIDNKSSKIGKLENIETKKFNSLSIHNKVKFVN